MPTTRATVELTIHRPVSEVYLWLSHYAWNTKWQEGVLVSEQVSPGEPHVGAKLRYVRKALGREIETTAQIAELVPDRKLRVRSDNSLFTYAGGYDLAPAGTGTKLTYQGEITTRAMLGLVGMAVAKVFQQQMEGDLGRLKALLEAA